MSLEIMRDPRVRGIEWRDLVALSRWEVVRELCLPVPWFGCTCGASGSGGVGTGAGSWRS